MFTAILVVFVCCSISVGIAVVSRKWIAIPLGLAVGVIGGVHLGFQVGSHMPRTWQHKDTVKIVGVAGVDNLRVFVRKFNEDGVPVYQVRVRKWDDSEQLLTIRATQDIVGIWEEESLLDSGVMTVQVLAEDTSWSWANWAFWNTEDAEPRSYTLVVPPDGVEFVYGPVTEE